MSSNLLFMEGVELIGGIKLSDISAVAGDIIWTETTSQLYSSVVISMYLGLIDPVKGKYMLAGGKPTNGKQKNLISFFDTTWDIGVKDAETFVKMIALNYHAQMSTVSSEFKRIIKGLGAEYAMKIEFEELKPSTKSIVSTATTLALPFPVILLRDPYYGLEKNSADFLAAEISRLSKDGSLILIFSEAAPPVYTKQVQIIEEF
jgi:ABC-type Mn2+/Zn2+ transport system ATPase subunit